MDKKTLGIVGLIVVVVLVGLFASGTFNRSASDQLAAGGRSGQGGGGGGGGGGTIYCSDSDGGVNTAVKGTTQTYTLKKNGTQSITATQTDYCSGTSSVMEYSCSASTIATTNAPCATGSSCVDGACVISSGGGGDTVPPVASMFGFIGSSGVVNNIVIYSNVTTNDWSVAVQATDNVTIGEVRFLIDGTDVTYPGIIYPPTSSQSSYYGENLYTRSIEQAIRERGMGTHTVTAVVCDSSNNCTTASNGLTATVQENTTKSN